MDKLERILTQMEMVKDPDVTYGCYVRKEGITQDWVRFDNLKTEADLDKAIAMFEWLGFEVS